MKTQDNVSVMVAATTFLVAGLSFSLRSVCVGIWLANSFRLIALLAKTRRRPFLSCWNFQRKFLSISSIIIVIVICTLLLPLYIAFIYIINTIITVIMIIIIIVIIISSHIIIITITVINIMIITTVLLSSLFLLSSSSLSLLSSLISLPSSPFITIISIILMISFTTVIIVGNVVILIIITITRVRMRSDFFYQLIEKKFKQSINSVWVLRPHWRIFKANNLKHYCAAAHMQCTAAIENRCNVSLYKSSRELSCRFTVEQVKLS